MGSAAVQGQLWSRAAHDWAELQEPLALPLWEAMLDAAAVGADTRVLDAGCGAGGASVLAAGRDARVNGLDAAPDLLAIARRRVPDGHFRLGDLEALPYADETFEAIIVADVLPYVADLAAPLRELRRVCAPRGRVVLTTLGAPEECAQHALVAAVQALLPGPLDEQWPPFRPSLAAPDAVKSLLSPAGLSVAGGGAVTCLYAYPDFELAWQAQASTGPLQAAICALCEQRVKAAVLRALVPYATDTGGVCIPHRFRYVIAVPAEDGPAG